MALSESRTLYARGTQCVVHSFVGDQSSHLLVVENKSVLIDCHLQQLAGQIRSLGLPQPTAILHTHVQPEHCREGDSFASAKIFVPRGTAELAGDVAGYRARIQTKWDNPADWPRTMGREAYGIAGCVTHRPPEMPLAVSGEISPGEVLAVGPMQLRAVALPGHGLCALGYVLETAVEPREVLALFSGDLLRDGPCLVNMYDLETTYGGTAVHELPSLLRIAAALDAPVFFPATGPVLPHGPGSAIELAGRIEEFLDSLRWSSGQFSPASAPATPPFSLGRYARIQRGVYQITNFGNCIVLIDDLGRGLMVDPGPCDFENSRRVEAFHADLDLLEKDGGLKSIERLLITHFHGDHYDMTQQVLRRYPRCRVAAWDLVAQVIESPDDFPYACKLPWYNLGLDRVQVDDVTHVGKPYFWNDIRIDTEHLPGHSEAHAAYVLIFNGSRLAITGDSIQSRGDADGLNYILCNESVPEENSGCIAAYKAISRHAIDLNVGGHGSHFRDCAAQYAESLRRMRHALPFLRNLFPPGDLRAAFHRPWFPDLRERRVTTDPA